MKNYIEILKDGGIGIMPTDTTYGLVGSALLEKTVERIYVVRKRNPSKPCIILIDSISTLQKFGIAIDVFTEEKLKDLWPGKVSVVLPTASSGFHYLDRNTNTLAFRLPNDKNLLHILAETGPLIAPSSNPEGFPCAKNIDEAKEYFGDDVDFYKDGGEIIAVPSTLVSIQAGEVKMLREGDVKVL